MSVYSQYIFPACSVYPSARKPVQRYEKPDFPLKLSQGRLNPSDVLEHVS